MNAAFLLPLYADGRLATIDDSSVWIDLSKLFFVSGASEIPPAGFQNRPEICFDQDCDDRLPHSSTCGPTLYLPVSLTDITTFQHKMGYAILCGQGFGTTRAKKPHQYLDQHETMFCLEFEL